MIYFIQGETTKLIKIGVTENIFDRLKSLQCGSAEPLRVRALGIDYFGGYHQERVLHRKFDLHRVHGEWFDASPELLSLIENVKASGEIDPSSATIPVAARRRLSALVFHLMDNLEQTKL